MKTKWFQLTQRQRLSLLPNLYSMEAITEEMGKFLGFTYKKLILTCEQRLMHIFIEDKGRQRVDKLALKKVLKQPKIIAQALRLVEKYGQIFVRDFKKISAQDLSKYSNYKLDLIYQKYYRDYRRVYGYYFSILTVERPVSEWLMSRLASQEKNKNKCLEYFSILTLAPKAMVAFKERIELLKIAALIRRKKRKDWQKDSLILRWIKNHQKRFFWLTRDYEDPILTVNDIIKRLHTELKHQPEKELKLIENKYLNNDQKIKALEKRLHLNKLEKDLFKLLRDGLDLKEYRKAVVSQTLYYFDSVLLEIGRRAGLSLPQMRNILPSEIKIALLGRDLSRVLNERIRFAVAITRKGKSKVLSGRPAEKWRKILFPKIKQEKALYGLTVSFGYARGPAKIVMHPSEIKKIKKGDILVTVQAVPSFAPAFRLASGVVADGGTGITSHTATLAREANIPAISGCKIATKIIKDGQIIELNTERDEVKIL